MTLTPERLAAARRIAAQASDPIKVVAGLTAATAWMIDGGRWSTDGRRAALIVPPRLLGGEWLDKAAQDAIARRLRELEDARWRARGRAA